ncbi:MAG: MFS transporter [Rhodocyclaceae bacterium]|nr:MFS transporter [Rhodocyclaceae bacterium]MBX3671099.1 MFS transporter [Rhodocyclaceae bacterium]
MSAAELRAGAALASIFSLRMLGLFIILPVFAVHARTIPGGDSSTLIGIALGAYGGTQALLQLPFGAASDRYGRKAVITFGLLLFALGSVVAAFAPNIWITIAGRCLQGAGAVSAAITALAADLTRDEHRTKVMAMIGSSIGLMFAVSLMAAPLLYAAVGMRGMFLLTAVLAVSAIVVLFRVVPDPPPPHAGPPVTFGEVLGDPQLLRLDFGIFALHATQMAMFVVVPGALVATGNLPVHEHWKIYMPAVLASFALMVPAVYYAERHARLKPVFLSAIGLLLATQFGLFLAGGYFAAIVALLVAFFVAFNVLEATLPSIISRIAPPRAKGLALGIYNTSQSLGLFVGGAAGGWLRQHHGPTAAFGLGIALVAVWLAWAWSMQPLPVAALREYAIAEHLDLDKLRARLQAVAGVREISLAPDKRIAYLKIYLGRCDEQHLERILKGEA